MIQGFEKTLKKSETLIINSTVLISLFDFNNTNKKIQ
jgi:hypothetical protein